jgi:hypothetical protein
VVSINEIQARYHFGAKQAVRMAIAAVITAVILFAVFHNQNWIIAFLEREGTWWRVLAAACVVVFVPTFAFIYSAVPSLLLRMIKLD